MKKLLLLIITCLLLWSCSETKPNIGELDFGQNNIYKLDSTQSQAIVDSSFITLNDSIHVLGKVQFPINRAVVTDDYTLLMNIAIPGNNLNLVLQQQNADKRIITRKEQNFLIKADTNYVARSIFKCPEETEFIYEFNFVTSDSLKAIELFNELDSKAPGSVTCQ